MKIRIINNDRHNTFILGSCAPKFFKDAKLKTSQDSLSYAFRNKYLQFSRR
jgi:hypothetical protein